MPVPVPVPVPMRMTVTMVVVPVIAPMLAVMVRLAHGDRLADAGRLRLAALGRRGRKGGACACAENENGRRALFAQAAGGLARLLAP